MKDTGRLVEATVGDFKGCLYNETKAQLSEEAVKKPLTLMTTIEVAYYFSISTADVQMLTRYGYLISYGIAHRVWYKQHEIENMNITREVIENVHKLANN